MDPMHHNDEISKEVLLDFAKCLPSSIEPTGFQYYEDDFNGKTFAGTFRVIISDKDLVNRDTFFKIFVDVNNKNTNSRVYMASVVKVESEYINLKYPILAEAPYYEPKNLKTYSNSFVVPWNFFMLYEVASLDSHVSFSRRVKIENGEKLTSVLILADSLFAINN